MTTRGIRNNNPGNIDYNPKNAFHGQLGLETVPDGYDYHPRFGRFDTAQNGIRAIAVILLTYYRKGGIKTIRRIVDRWAPSTENNTDAYVKSLVFSVRGKFDFDPANAVQVADMPLCLENATILGALVAGIILHENGEQPYTFPVIAAAVNDALNTVQPS